MSSEKIEISGRQVAAARELLHLTRAELAAAAGVGESSVYRFEEGLKVPRGSTEEKIRTALERRGIEFLNHGAPGVRVRPEKAVIPR